MGKRHTVYLAYEEAYSGRFKSIQIPADTTDLDIDLEVNHKKIYERLLVRQMTTAVGVAGLTTLTYFTINILCYLNGVKLLGALGESPGASMVSYFLVYLGAVGLYMMVHSLGIANRTLRKYSKKTPTNKG